MSFLLDVLADGPANVAWDNFCDFCENKYDFQEEDYGSKFDQELAVYGGKNVVNTIYAEFETEQQATFWLLKWA